MEIDRGMWKRYENISTSCRLVSQFLSISSMLDVLYAAYIYYIKRKQVWIRTLVNTVDLTLFNRDILNWFAGVCEQRDCSYHILKVKRAISASQAASTRLPLLDKQVVQLKSQKSHRIQIHTSPLRTVNTSH